MNTPSCSSNFSDLKGPHSITLLVAVCNFVLVYVSLYFGVYWMKGDTVKSEVFTGLCPLARIQQISFHSCHNRGQQLEALKTDIRELS